MVAIHRNQTEMDLWKRAEETAREDLNAENPREGEILGQICAAYLGTDGPLKGGAGE